MKFRLGETFLLDAFVEIVFYLERDGVIEPAPFGFEFAIKDLFGASGKVPGDLLFGAALDDLVKRINATPAGWATYFRVGNLSRAFSEVRDYVEMKVRTLLTRRKRRRKRSVGWRRWSNEYLYDVLGLYWDWKIQPLPGVGKGT